MISVNNSLILQIVNFLFLIWVLNLILYRPIRGIIRQRKEKIEDLEKSIAASQKDAEEKQLSLTLGIRDARAKGIREKEMIVQAAEEEEKQILDRLARKAQADLAQIREKVARESEAARRSLEKELGTFASAIAQKILGRSVQ